MKITKSADLLVVLFLCVLPPLLVRSQQWDPSKSADLFVTANTYELIGFVDNAVTMYATVRGNPRPTADDIVWIKMGDNLPMDRVEITYDTATNETRLRITGLQYTDAGTYFCQANVGGVSKSVSMTLRVVVEPGVERVSGLITAKGVGQSAVFSVTVSGNPLPTSENITWAKLDDLNLPTQFSDDRWSYGDGNKEFTISDLVISDEGWYKCLVTTDEGKAEVSFTLNVLGMREIQSEGVGVVGNSATLTCVATYFQMLPTAPDITWYRFEDKTTPLNGAEIKRSISPVHAVSTLTLDSLTWDDEGQYFCTSSYSGYPDHSIYNATLYVRGVTDNPTDTIGIHTNNSTLSCTASGNPTFTWSKEGTGTVTMVTSVTSTDSNVTSRLYFSNIQMSEAGNYKCIADYGGLGEHASAYANFTVYELSKVPANTYTEVGTAVELLCASNGVPDTVRWYKDDLLLSPTSGLTISTKKGESTLSIGTSEFTHEGYYYCKYLFEEGEIGSSPIFLSIRGFLVEPISSVGVEENTVSFTCVVHGESQPAITWTKSGTEVPKQSISTEYTAPNTTSVLTLDSLSYSSDNGAEVACSVIFTAPALSIGSSVATLKVLRIIVPPIATTAVASLTATLTCTVDNTGSVSWYNGTTALSPTTQSLVLDPVSVYDEGEYHCTAQFPASSPTVFGGTTTAPAVKLTVQRFTELPTDQYVNVGETAEFQCTGSGEPTVVWFKGSEEIQRDTVGTLTRSDAQYQSGGEYSCSLEYSQLGQITSPPVQLVVRGVSTSPVEAKAVLGQSTVFQCTARGDIQPTFYWTRNDLNVTGESTVLYEAPYTYTNFTYSGVVSEDVSGKFRCIAVFDNHTTSAVSDPAAVDVIEVTKPPTDVYGVVGNSATLSCTTEGNPTPDDFAWLFQDQQITTAAVAVKALTSEITQMGLTRDMEGEYACVPTYPAQDYFPGGNTTSATGYLTVIGITDPPVQTIVRVGDTAVFTCKANATPTPTLTWYKSDKTRTTGVSAPKKESEKVVSTLTVEEVGDDDVAPYSCKAEYPSLGSHTSEPANLRFRGIEVPPIVTEAVLGLPNQLNCTARGESVADMKWTANGTLLSSTGNFKIDVYDNSDPSKEQELIDTRTVLSVTEVDLDTAYLEITCSATWISNGQASVVESEIVAFSPLYVFKSPVNTIAVRYTQVKLTCAATGIPSVRWDRSGRTYGYGLMKSNDYGPNGLLKPGEDSVESVLTLGNVTSADQGKIWCVGIYEQGSHDSAQATLTVVGIIEEPKTTYLTQRGQSAQFTCIVDRYPAHTTTWYKGEDKIQGFENRVNITRVVADYTVENLLSVSSVSEEDMDSYYCQVQYEQGTQTSQPAQLLIREPPQITLIVATGGEKEGDSIELLCQATGVPKPTITWRVGGQTFPSDETVSTVEVFNEPGSSLVLINSSSSQDQGVYSCVASNGVGESVVMETEVQIQAAVKYVTVGTASSLLVFIVAVCTALMLFALYRKRKRKRLAPDEEKTIPPKDEETQAEMENHIYDNEASIFGDVKSCDDDDYDNESGIECDDDIPTVEPPDENPALFLMPDRKAKELPPLDRGSHGAPLSQHPLFHITKNNTLPSLGGAANLPPLPDSIFDQEYRLLNSSPETSGERFHGLHAGLVPADNDPVIGLTPIDLPRSDRSPSPSGYQSGTGTDLGTDIGTDLGSSGGLPSSGGMPSASEVTRRVSLLNKPTLNGAVQSPDPHVPQSYN